MGGGGRKRLERKREEGGRVWVLRGGIEWEWEVEVVKREGGLGRKQEAGRRKEGVEGRERGRMLRGGMKMGLSGVGGKRGQGRGREGDREKELKGENGRENVGGGVQ